MLTPVSWHQHLAHLLLRSWDATVGAMSTSNLAIAVGVVIVVPALYKVIRQRGLRSVVTNWRRGLLTSTSLGFLAWVLLFAWHVVLQVYQDTRSLLSEAGTWRLRMRPFWLRTVVLLRTLERRTRVRGTHHPGQDWYPRSNTTPSLWPRTPLPLRQRTTPCSTPTSMPKLRTGTYQRK